MTPKTAIFEKLKKQAHFSIKFPHFWTHFDHFACFGRQKAPTLPPRPQNPSFWPILTILAISCAERQLVLTPSGPGLQKQPKLAHFDPIFGHFLTCAHFAATHPGKTQKIAYFRVQNQVILAPGFDYFLKSEIPFC